MLLTFKDYSTRPHIEKVLLPQSAAQDYSNLVLDSRLFSFSSMEPPTGSLNAIELQRGSFSSIEPPRLRLNEVTKDYTPQKVTV